MAVTVKRPRIVVSKLALEGDDRGAKLIARLLRDAGVEVIYTGPEDRPEGIVETAIQEDADAVALSILSGEHMVLVPRILELLRAGGAGEVRVVVSGTIPADDAAALERLGVTAVLNRGSAVERVATLLRCEASRTAPCL
ncbi:MAG: cobalamin-dependent protein [Thermoleophilaceae bacterium]